jgi:hypothetical protein
MPDFERLLDGLQAHLAKTPEEQAYVRGFQDGKNLARKELLRVGIGFGLGWALWCVLR